MCHCSFLQPICIWAYSPQKDTSYGARTTLSLSEHAWILVMPCENVSQRCTQFYFQIFFVDFSSCNHKQHMTLFETELILLLFLFFTRETQGGSNASISISQGIGVLTIRLLWWARRSKSASVWIMMSMVVMEEHRQASSCQGTVPAIKSRRKLFSRIWPLALMRHGMAIQLQCSWRTMCGEIHCIYMQKRTHLDLAFVLLSMHASVRHFFFSPACCMCQMHCNHGRKC